MPDQDNVGVVLLVRLQPGAELVPGYFDGLVGLVPGIDLGVDDVRLAQLFPQKVVDVCGEGAERGVIAHEAMNVDDQQGPPVLVLVDGGPQRLGAGRAGVSCLPCMLRAQHVRARLPWLLVR